MTESRPNVVLIGAGNMGTNHARVISESSRANLVALIDPRPSVGNAVAERFGTTWAPALDDLDSVDAVIVAAATEAHFEIAMQVLGADTPLLIEKPVAGNLSQTKTILDLAAERDLPLMCGFLERFNPAVLTAQALSDTPIHITATRHSPYASRIRTGVSWDLLVHDVDLAIRMMGELPSAVSSSLGFFHPDSDAAAEDVAETLLKFGSGSVAQVSASRVGQRKIRQMSVYEHDRLVEVDLLRRDVTVYRHISENSADGAGRGYRQQTVIEIPELVTSTEPLTAQFDHFLDLIAGRADAAMERASILPAHQVIHEVTTRATAV